VVVLGLLCLTLAVAQVARHGAAPTPFVFGADYFACDGQTDAAPGLQAAENRRRKTGAILILPAGICRIASATIRVEGPGKWIGAGSAVFDGAKGTILRDARPIGDTIAVVSHGGMTFEDFRIDVATLKTSGAGISLGTPSTQLATTAARGVTHLAVRDARPFDIGDQVEVALDVAGNGSTYTGRVMSTDRRGGIVTVSPGLPVSASAGNQVWDVYNQRSDLTRVVIAGTYDGLRIDCADFVTVAQSTFQDYAHDGILKINQCAPDGGGDKYTDNTIWDLNRGNSRAGFEFRAGGDIAVSGNKFLGSGYGLLFNMSYGPTGTARVTGNSLEEQRVARIAAVQAVRGVEFGNLVIVGNQFSDIAAQPTQGLFYIGRGYPTSAATWIRNVVFVGNVSNDAVKTAAPSVQILDGSGFSVTGNVLDNNGVAGPTAISIEGAAAKATIAANQLIGYPSGRYGALSPGVVLLDGGAAATAGK
jgi:hypothetical protein